MIFVARVEMRSVFDEELRSREIAGEVEWRAAISASRVNQRRVTPQKIDQFVSEAEGRGGMDAERGAMRDKQPCDFGRDMSSSEPALPLLADALGQTRVLAKKSFDAREG